MYAHTLAIIGNHLMVNKTNANNGLRREYCAHLMWMSPDLFSGTRLSWTREHGTSISGVSVHFTCETR